jgi:hypothetical protein
MWIDGTNRFTRDIAWDLYRAGIELTGNSDLPYIAGTVAGHWYYTDGSEAGRVAGGVAWYEQIADGERRVIDCGWWWGVRLLEARWTYGHSRRALGEQIAALRDAGLIVEQDDSGDYWIDIDEAGATA